MAANTDRNDVMVRLPTIKDDRKWYRVADTSIEDESCILEVEKAEELLAQERYILPANSMLVLVAK